jgi:hypothetical protein
MKTKDAKAEPQVCCGTYFPRQGRPKKEYYVVLEENVLAGPFRQKRSARELLSKLPVKDLRNTLASRPGSLKRLEPSYAKMIESVLRKQDKVILAAVKASKG